MKTEDYHILMWEENEMKPQEESYLKYFKEEELRQWLGHKYPCTIVRDRYDGTYSKGAFIAFPLDNRAVPEYIHSDDVECASFWGSFKDLCGRGETPDKAYWNLVDNVRYLLNMKKENLDGTLKLEKKWIKTPILDGKSYIIGFDKCELVCGIGESEIVDEDNFSESFSHVYIDCVLAGEDNDYYYMKFKKSKHYSDE